MEAEFNAVLCARTGAVIRAGHVFPTKHAKMEVAGLDLDMWQEDVCGAGAVVAAVDAVLSGDGTVATLIGSDHPKDGGVVRRIVTFGVGHVDHKPCVRYCGEGMSPNGAGSSSVIMSGVSTSLDRTTLCATLALEMGKYACVYRGRVPVLER